MPPMGLNPAGGMPGGIPRPYDIGGAAAAGPRGNIIPGAGPPTPRTGPVNPGAAPGTTGIPRPAGAAIPDPADNYGGRISVRFVA